MPKFKCCYKLLCMSRVKLSTTISIEIDMIGWRMSSP